MVKEISYQKLAELLKEGAELVDVREAEELRESNPLGGKNWPLSTFGLRQREVSGTRPTIFYCRSGLRSLKAAEIAESWTKQTVYSLEGGLLNANLKHIERQSTAEEAQWEKAN